MNVNISIAPDSVEQDILILEMTEYQNRLNTEYNNKLNGIIAELTTGVQDYLDRLHPGLNVPQDGPHFQVVRNVFEEFAILSLDKSDLEAKCERYRNVLRETCSRIYSKIDVEDEEGIGSVEAIQEKILSNIQSLEYIHSTMGMMGLDCERHHSRLSSKLQKVLDLAKQATDEDDAVADDDFLGILRKGILSVNKESFQLDLRSLEALGEMLRVCREREENVLLVAQKRVEIFKKVELLQRTVDEQKKYDEIKQSNQTKSSEDEELQQEIVREGI